jgi:hypothetical protein
MKIAICFLVLAVVAAVCGQNCPVPDGQFVTLFAHPTDCTKFFKCWAGEACELWLEFYGMVLKSFKY